jgi:hypothetical protein
MRSIMYNVTVSNYLLIFSVVKNDKNNTIIKLRNILRVLQVGLK